MNNDDIKILILDDEEGMCKLLKNILQEEGYSIHYSTSPEKSLEYFDSENFDIAIVDIKMPEIDGIEFIKRTSSSKNKTYFIMITAYGSIENAVEAIKFGAFDYITKPFQSDEIKIAVNKIVDRLKLIEENKRLKDELKKLHMRENISSVSKEVLDILSHAQKVSRSQLSVLITGESGTGKEVIAKHVHKCSERRDAPFVPVQCSLLPVNLLESELFGYKKGSFTGANADRPGLFEQANGGTIFLDEIGDISPDTQGKLLRFLQDHEIRRIGDTNSKKLDVRLIFATNKNLEKLVKEEKFREDLYFRLKVLTIHLPPLRERKEDIPILTNHFIIDYSKTNNCEIEIEGDCLLYLKNYDWPGNIRELKNCIECACVLCENNLIKIADIKNIINIQEVQKISATRNEIPSFKAAKAHIIENFEKTYFINMLVKHQGNIAAASRESKIDRKNFWQFLKKYNIEPEIYKE